MKASVLYHSKSGNTQKMAAVIVKGMMEVDGVEVKAFAIDAPDETFVKESSCVILGTPTYLANMSGAMKSWLESSSMKLGLAGKLGGAFATADYIHGGGDIAIRTILDHLMVLGMLTYAGGGAYGKPVIHLGPVALGGHLEDSEELFTLYGQRMATKASELFK